MGGEIEVVDTIPLSLTAVKADDTFAEVVGPQDAVVSVTLLPQRGLGYKAEYRLRVTGAIEDLDATPRSLEPEYTSTFTTFGPEDLETESEKFSSVGWRCWGPALHAGDGVRGGHGLGAAVRGAEDVRRVGPVEPRRWVRSRRSTSRRGTRDGSAWRSATQPRMYYTYSGEVRSWCRPRGTCSSTT